MAGLIFGLLYLFGSGLVYNMTLQSDDQFNTADKIGLVIIGAMLALGGFFLIAESVVHLTQGSM